MITVQGEEGAPLMIFERNPRISQYTQYGIYAPGQYKKLSK